MPSIYQIETRIRQQRVSQIYYKGEMRNFVLKKNRILFCKQPVKLPQTLIRIKADADGDWMEFGFLSAHLLSGNPATGYTDPGHYLTLTPQSSIDLISWTTGEFIPAPIGAVVDNGDGTYYYWSRSLLAKNYNLVLANLTSQSDRHAKSITALHIAGQLVALPSYPYLMPDQMDDLRADLNSAGYALGPPFTIDLDATITCTILNHVYEADSYNQAPIYPTINASAQVTATTSHNGTAISLPSYPYSLPAQAAALQTDLRAAGYSGAVVKLHSASWTLNLRDVTLTTPASRTLDLTITPADPHPHWDQFGVYLGLNPDDKIGSTYSNVRSIEGASLPEASKQFARLLLTKGTRYDHLTP